MIQRIIFFIRLFIFWLLFFASFRVVFILYQFEHSAKTPLTDLFLAFWHAQPLDIAFASYICALPFVIITLGIRINNSLLKKMIDIFQLLLISLLTFIHVVDLEIYKNWGSHLDVTPLLYLKNPKEAFASAGAAPMWLLILLLVGFILLSRFVSRKWVTNPIMAFKHTPLWAALVLLLPTSLLGALQRGGFQKISINQSAVYFSTNSFANHAAFNVPWNLSYSITEELYNDKNPYQFFSRNEAEKLLISVKPAPKSSFKISTVEHPNIMLIVWESCSSKLLDTTICSSQITPNLKRLSKTEVYFDNFYAYGDRSDKGLACLLSGFPALTTRSVMKHPAKVLNLPGLPKDLKSSGYTSSMYYGGDLSFANMNAYFRAIGMENIIAENELDNELKTSNWGVPDHLMFKEIIKGHNSVKEPFFTCFFTLSSHEPYDVPETIIRHNGSEEGKFKNAMAYTDKSLGDFIDDAKKEAWWAKTLVIITADHGHRLPGNSGSWDPEKYNIPLIITGGAAAFQDTTIHRVADQTDLSTTILHQLHLPTDRYPYGTDLFSDRPGYGAFVFRDGLTAVTDTGVAAYNLEGDFFINNTDQPTFDQINPAKAILQLSFDAFLNMEKPNYEYLNQKPKQDGSR